jgi:hypothetical protein
MRLTIHDRKQRLSLPLLPLWILVADNVIVSAATIIPASSESSESAEDSTLSVSPLVILL